MRCRVPAGPSDCCFQGVGPPPGPIGKSFVAPLARLDHEDEDVTNDSQYFYRLTPALPCSIVLP